MQSVMSYAFKERRQAIKYLAWRIGLTTLLFWVVLAFVLPLAYWVGAGFSDQALVPLENYFKRAFHNPFYVWQTYFTWFESLWLREPLHFTWASFVKWRLPLLPTLAYVMVCVHFIVTNPFDYGPQYYGYGREARKSDLKQMRLDHGKYLYLGDLGDVQMRLPDTRSAFCIGAPGSGKTAGVIIPNILKADNACLFVFDPTGDLMKKTSGYRATLGPVYKIDFTAVDDPAKGEYKPSWNPLNEENMPPQHKGRDGYIDGLIEFLIPDGPEGTDPYWVKAGRSCLTGLTIYTTNKVEQAKANDYFVARLSKGTLDKDDLVVLKSYYKGMQQVPEVVKAIAAIEDGTFSKSDYVPIGTWDPMPKQWIGKEASFGMLLDLLNNWMFAKSRELRERRNAGDMNAANLDVWQSILDTIVSEIFFYGYSRRALLEVNQTYALPDKQRASVLSMAQSGIEPFKNSAIRQRTASNDFKYDDFRGVKDPVTGQYKPVTFYVGGGGGSVCTLFINMISGHLMSKGQSEGNMGPFAVEFILDDFGKMPKLQSIADGVTFGRSKGNVYLIAVQDWHQITSKYGDNTTDVILSSVAAKIIKRQNNVTTRNKMTRGIMDTTRVVEAGHGGEVGFGKNVNPFVRKGGSKRKKDGVVGGTGLLNMAPAKQVVLYSGFYHRPIQAKCPLYFKDEKLKALASMAPAPDMPEQMRARKAKEKPAYVDIQLDSLASPSAAS